MNIDLSKSGPSTEIIDILKVTTDAAKSRPDKRPPVRCNGRHSRPPMPQLVPGKTTPRATRAAGHKSIQCQ